MLAAVLIGGTFVARVVYLAFFCPLDLAPDEAHYWDWSRQLDWSYYSKGPLVAYLIRLSCIVFGPISQALMGSEMLAVRLPAVACGSLLLISLYVLTVRVFGREGLAFAVVAAFATLPLFAVGSTLMTIDAPFICCWGWALVAGHRALFHSGESVALLAWISLGILVGVGMLAKYTMVLFLPALALFCLMTSGHRNHLLQPGFWLACIIAGVCCLPIVIWNAQHGWVTLLHTRGHAGLDERGVQWHGPLNYLGLQAAVLLGFWFVAWLRAAIAERPGKTSPDAAYLWWLSVPVFGFFLGFSFKNGGGEANWPVATYLAGMVMAVAWLAKQLESPNTWYRRLTQASIGLTAVIGVVLIFLLHDSRLIRPILANLADPPSDARPFPLRRFDPTCRLRGWKALAVEIDRLRDELGNDVVVAGIGWSWPGEIGFYCKGHPTVYSVGAVIGDRHSQYDFWRPNPVADPTHFYGKTFIIVAGDPISFEGAFDSTDPARVIRYDEDGQPIARFALMVGRGFRGFRSLSTGSDEY